VLLLDEPTNHLDLDSKEVLLEALADYGGTLVFVSHDRYFVDNLATKVIEVGGGEALLYPGGYEDFLYWKKQREAGIDAPVAGSKGPKPPAPVAAPARGERDDGTASVATRSPLRPKPAAAHAAVRQARAPVKAKATPGPKHATAPPAQPSPANPLAPRIRQSGTPPERQVLEREVKRMKTRLAELEARVADAEQAVKTLEAQMAEPGFYDDRARAAQAADDHQKRMWEAGELMAQWEALQGELDEKSRELAAVTPAARR
jgi:ATP-binding cassette subfamily F protein 3